MANEYLDNSINNSSLIANVAGVIDQNSQLNNPLSNEIDETSLKYIPVLTAQKESYSNLKN